MNLYFYFDDAKVQWKTTDSKYSIRFFLNYLRHTPNLATKRINTINLCRERWPHHIGPKGTQAFGITMAEDVVFNKGKITASNVRMVEMKQELTEKQKASFLKAVGRYHASAMSRDRTTWAMSLRRSGPISSFSLVVQRNYFLIKPSGPRALSPWRWGMTTNDTTAVFKGIIWGFADFFVILQPIFTIEPK